MPDTPREDRIQYVVLLNGIPINVHTSEDPTSSLKKYYKKAHSISELSDRDEAIISKKVSALKKSGKAAIKGYQFLKVDPSYDRHEAE